MAPNFQERLPEYACDFPTVLFLARLPARISLEFLRALKDQRPYFDTENMINEFIPVVGMLWPVKKAAELLRWVEENDGLLPREPGEGTQPRSDDAVVGRWGALTHQIFRFSVPCLIEHPDEEPSTIGLTAQWGRDEGRVAVHFG